MKFKYILSFFLITFYCQNSSGFFNLNIFGKKAKTLIYKFIGGYVTSNASYVSGSYSSFVSSDAEGAFPGNPMIAIDAANDRMYTASGPKIQKFVLSSSSYLGAIGKSQYKSGTCIVGAQTGWCQGAYINSNANGYNGMLEQVGDAAIDGVGDKLYVVDYQFNRVSKFTASTGAFIGSIGKTDGTGACLAGPQTSWCTGGQFHNSFTGTIDGVFNVPQKIAIDTTNDRMYITDSTNHRVQKFVLSTGAALGSIGNSTATGTCIAGAQTGWCTGGVFSSGAGDGMLNSPYGIAVDVAGNTLLVADKNNRRVQKFNLSTGAFVGAIGKSTASGTCIAGAQTGWCTGGVFSAGTSDGMFNFAMDIKVDVGGNAFYVADSYRIEKFTLSTGAFVGSIGYVAAPAGTCIAGAQTGWCTGGTFAYGTLDGTFGNFNSFAIDPTNNALYAPNANMGLQKFNLSTGAYVGTIGGMKYTNSAWATQSSKGPGIRPVLGTTDGMFQYATNLALDVAGNRLYVVDSTNHRVQKINLTTGSFIGAIGKSTASGTCLSGAQTGWCAGGVFSTGASDGMFSGLTSIALDIAGDKMYVGDWSNHRIQKFTLSTGAFVGAIGNSTASGTCVAGKQTSWCTGGVFSSGSGDGMFNRAEGLAIDVGGNAIYVTDYTNHRVQKFNLSTGAFIGTIGNSTASGTCVAGKQNSWCVGGAFSSGSGDGMFNNPSGIAIDTVSNTLLISEYANHRVQKFNLSTGAFVGAIGNSTASGTCVAGAQPSWCTGGVFSTAVGDGKFQYPIRLAVDVAADVFYVVQSYKFSKYSFSTGAFIGSIGYAQNPGGTCVLGVQSNWCSGETGMMANTFVGEGGGPFRGVALDPVGKKIYYSDDFKVNQISY